MNFLIFRDHEPPIVPWWFFRRPFQLPAVEQRPGTRYSEVAPAVRDFRAAVLDVAKGTKAGKTWECCWIQKKHTLPKKNSYDWLGKQMRFHIGGICFIHGGCSIVMFVFGGVDLMLRYIHLWKCRSMCRAIMMIRGIGSRKLRMEFLLFGNVWISNGCFLKWWYPTTMDFPTKNNQLWGVLGYHHFRKPPNTSSKGWFSIAMLVYQRVFANVLSSQIPSCIRLDWWIDQWKDGEAKEYRCQSL